MPPSTSRSSASPGTSRGASTSSSSGPGPVARQATEVISYLALAPRRTEPLLAAELRALFGVTEVEELAGAVSFRGPLSALYRANLWLRCATRVLRPLSDLPCRGEKDLYDQARAVPWEEFLRHSGTLAVSAHGQVPGLQNSMFSAVRVKDAVVDRFRDRTGNRPSVDARDPDVQINVHLYDDPSLGGPRCALSLDSSGQALHRRGYRQVAAAAPLKETLAAAIVALSGYGRETRPTGEQKPKIERRPLLDLCCGSGTLVIEAGLVALQRAPGLYRAFGFQRWLGHDAKVWRQVLAEAEAMSQPEEAVFLHGSDIDQRMVEASQRNAAAAGLGKSVRFVRLDLGQARPPEGPPGVVLCNPPYGERMGEEQDLIPLYRGIGDTLKRHFSGYTAWVFTANLVLAKQIGLRPKERHVLYNGDLEGRLLRFDLY